MYFLYLYICLALVVLEDKLVFSRTIASKAGGVSITDAPDEDDYVIKLEVEVGVIAIKDEESKNFTYPDPYVARCKDKALAAIKKLLLEKDDVLEDHLEQPLLFEPGKVLPCDALMNTAHGRHLLMITLLENLGGEMWLKRCRGKLQIFLPASLRVSNQPSPPPDACLLGHIGTKNKEVQRKDVIEKIKRLVPSEMYTELFSWYKGKHRATINKLVDWVLEQESFQSSYSLLVTIRDMLTRQMFVEVVNLVTMGREEIGFILPSIESYMPENFFPPEYLEKFDKTSKIVEVKGDAFRNDVEGVEKELVLERSRRQVFNWQLQAPVMPPWQRVSSRRPTWQHPFPVLPPGVPRWQQPQPNWRPTLPPVSPVSRGQGYDVTWTRSSMEEAEWYFREDPVANAHHSEWHRTTGGRPDFIRYGEHFVFMHGQMLARYEAERMSLGLGVVVPMVPEQWDRWIEDSYDPRLGRAWALRPPGFISPEHVWRLGWWLDTFKSQAQQAAPMGYAMGVDWGISDLGHSLEVELHNAGHDAIADMSREARGVMAVPTGSMRDPIFYRWHAFVENLIREEYKNKLAPYSETDLGFPGVESVTVSVQPVDGDNNTFYTYREMTSVNLDSLDSTSPGSRMSVQYLRMNHRPFSWHIVINTTLNERTPAIVRLFMMPTSGGNSRDTIHMDHFYIDLDPGQNLIQREELKAPHLSKSRWSLSQLQDRLMNGQVSQSEFSWGGCGWPRHLNIPRGTEGGMEWMVVVMVSQVLYSDIPKLGTWNSNRNLAWSFCGVRSGEVPDSRPLGFPTDRDFGNLDSLVAGRMNWGVQSVRIVHGGAG